MPDLNTLTAFAARQLLRVGLSDSASEDIVQTALWMVEIGTHHRLKGRHPNSYDVEAHSNFITYLKGTIHSLVDTRRCHLENHFEHIGYDDDVLAYNSPIHAGAEVLDMVEFNELSNELFKRLNCRAPERLRGILNSWYQQRFDCDKIPLRGHHRRLRIELRNLAAKVIEELQTIGPPSAFGHKATEKENI